jgi:hypothetical protein
VADRKPTYAERLALARQEGPLARRLSERATLEEARTGRRPKRKGPRQTQIAVRTTEEAKAELHRLADRLGCSVVEALEFAIDAGHDKLDAQLPGAKR